MAKSIEEKVEDFYKNQLKENKIKFFTKTDSVNEQIDHALKSTPSKTAGGQGGNYPDIKVLVHNSTNRYIPVMIEAKGTKGRLEKMDKSGQLDSSPKAVKDYAVNGAIHYVNAILNNTDYQEAIAIGVNGTEDATGNLLPEIAAYYVSKKNSLCPKKIEKFTTLALLRSKNLDSLYKQLDVLNISPEELEAFKKRAESDLEAKIQAVHQRIYDSDFIGPLLQTDEKLYLFCGLIMAGMPIPGESNLVPEDLKGNLSLQSHDGQIVLQRISTFLKARKTPEQKYKIVFNLLENIFTNESLYKPREGESFIKTLYRDIQTDIIPCFNSNLHLDFTGKIFNKLGEWANIPTDKQNDVVLTPRYVTQLMAALAKTNKDSYVLDSAMGSAGFLVSAMEIMIRDAQNTISDKELLDQKIDSIKKLQICGVEILGGVFMLAIMNMILMGDGSSNLKHDDSLVNMPDFPTTVFLLNPPYSAEGKGLNFVLNALKKMQDGYACVLIQESAGSGQGDRYAAAILKVASLVASIKMPTDLFSGKASVQTAIFLFKAGEKHDPKSLVTFVDFSNDGYTRSNRKKSSQSVNLRDTDRAKERYAELQALILNQKKSTNFYSETNGLVIRDTISLSGSDWTYSQHVVLDMEPTLEDFKQTVKDYLTWQVSELIQRQGATLGK
jgi:type I restriction-modification system DNA methylase subunit